MKHREYKRIVAKDEKAVLFIHGIISTPNHFRDFVALVPDNMSVFNLLLDGHGKAVNDFARSSMKKWEAQVTSAVNELSENHEKIYIVAHSMGTLLAIDQALSNKKVAKMFFLSVPIKIFIKHPLISNTLKVFFDKIRPDDEIGLATKNCYGITVEKNILSYIGWIPRYAELIEKIHHIPEKIPLIQIPCYAYQSSNDEIVSTSTNKCLKKNDHIRVKELKNSGHHYYQKDDYSYLLCEFNKFINN